MKVSSRYLPVEDRVFVSTSCVSGDRHISAVLARLAGLSVRHVELSGPHPYTPCPELVAELLRYQESGMSFIIHNYFPPPETDFVLNIASFNDKVIGDCRNLINQALGLAREIGALFYGCHAGYLADASVAADGCFKFNTTSLKTPEACIPQAVRAVKSILKHNKNNLPAGGMLLENLFPSGHHENYSLACTPREIGDLFRAFGSPKPGLLLDLAHLELTCRLYGLSPDKALQEIMDTLGNFIRCVHLSGTDGPSDSHLPLRPQAWQLQAAGRLNMLPGTGNGIIFTLECRKIDDNMLLSQRNQLIDFLERRQ